MNTPIIPRPKSGKYISIEGLEGSGKTYYITNFCRKYPNRYTPVIELSKNGLGKKIIYVLSEESDEFFRHGHPISEALLFFSMKLFEMEKKIIPLLLKGRVVIEDRSVDSNCLYAGILLNEKYGRHSTYDYYKRLLKIRKELGPIPDKTICFLPDFKLAIERAQKRDERRYNQSEMNFLHKIDEGFREICKKQAKRIISIEFNKMSNAEIFERMKDIID